MINLFVKFIKRQLLFADNCLFVGIYFQLMLKVHNYSLHHQRFNLMSTSVPIISVAPPPHQAIAALA